MSDADQKWCEPCFYLKSVKIIAGVMCDDCFEMYCELCAQDHAKFRVFRNHRISQLSSNREYQNAEYVMPVSVTVGRQETDGLQRTSYYGQTYATKEETGSSSDVAPEVFRDTKPVKEPTNNKRDSNRFEVKVAVTDLVKRIPGIADIAESIFLLAVEKTKFSLFLKNREVFTCAFRNVRRYVKTINRVDMELGRGCAFGPGELCLICDDAKEVFSALRQTPPNKTDG